MPDRPLLVATVRVARPATDLDAVKHFYVDVVGLSHLGGFERHNGYDGLFIGLPETSWHLEFTRHDSGHPAPSPTDEDLLVVYLDPAELASTAARLEAAGHAPIIHPNPYWAATGALAFTDPDGYGLILSPQD